MEVAEGRDGLAWDSREGGTTPCNDDEGQAVLHVMMGDGCRMGGGVGGGMGGGGGG